MNNFWRAMLIALPISIALWAAIIFLIWITVAH